MFYACTFVCDLFSYSNWTNFYCIKKTDQHGWQQTLNIHAFCIIHLFSNCIAEILSRLLITILGLFHNTLLIWITLILLVTPYLIVLRKSNKVLLLCTIKIPYLFKDIFSWSVFVESLYSILFDFCFKKSSPKEGTLSITTHIMWSYMILSYKDATVQWIFFITWLWDCVTVSSAICFWVFF